MAICCKTCVIDFVVVHTHQKVVQISIGAIEILTFHLRVNWKCVGIAGGVISFYVNANPFGSL